MLVTRLSNAFRRPGLDAELFGGVVLLAAILLIGLGTARDYGISIDEFNTQDYGHKALAWYTSGFADRSQFETVEFSLWYYGPWFHILTALVQKLGLDEPFAVRHAMTFLVGWIGLAALLPLGRLTAGKWTGLAAIGLCLSTGYFYGSLFFTTIDVPFMAAITWAMVAILMMTRRLIPSWPSTVAAGLTIGLTVGTRTGGAIAFAYLAFALSLNAAAYWRAIGALRVRVIALFLVRFVAVLLIASVVAIALWPWLQLGNPLTQFLTAHRHFVGIPMSYEFFHWGKRVQTDALPVAYVFEQLAARLPLVFLALLAVSALAGMRSLAGLLILGDSTDAPAYPTRSLSWLAESRSHLVVLAAALVPPGLVALQDIHLYDGIRHLLFIIPMLAIAAGWGFRLLLPTLQKLGVIFPVLVGSYVAATVVEFSRLHPLEYVAMNALAGGTAGAYGRFELDYSAVAATEAARQLQDRLQYETSTQASPAKIMICIPWREWAAAPLLPPGSQLETELDAADYVIETERWKCAEGRNLKLIDEVVRVGRAFAWIYTRAPRH